MLLVEAMVEQHDLRFSFASLFILRLACEDVARVRICVEKLLSRAYAELEDLLREAVSKQVADFFDVDAFLLHRFSVVDVDTADELHHQHFSLFKVKVRLTAWSKLRAL